ncbi:MAG TPA: DUF3300 domain-containing protein [Opitutus sp.]|nr:DUF3300 domain-containing protein [Opitutus sp.]
MRPLRHLLLCASLLAGLGGGAATSVWGQTPTLPETAVSPAVSQLAPEQLEQLVAPIALYPDVLVALILPASTESSDVVLAARYLRDNGDANQIDAQSWDDDVKALARYPDVIKWMDENLAWTQQLGEAYLASPENVMAAVQRARSRAKADGLLVSTTQQTVLDENGYIRIVPAQPEVIYVPRYDYRVIYVEHPTYYQPDTWLTFGVGFGVGWWLHNDCDWGRRVIVVNRRPAAHWRLHDWQRQHFAHRPQFGDHWRPWTPPAGRPRPPFHRRDFTSRREFPHPGPVGPPRVDRDRDRRPQPGRLTDERRWQHRPSSPAGAREVKPNVPPPASGNPPREWTRNADRVPRVRPSQNVPSPSATAQAPAARPAHTAPPPGRRNEIRSAPMATSRPPVTAAPRAPQVAASAPAPRAPAVAPARAPSFSPRSEPTSPGGSDRGRGDNGRGRAPNRDR